MDEMSLRRMRVRKVQEMMEQLKKSLKKAQVGEVPVRISKQSWCRWRRHR